MNRLLSILCLMFISSMSFGQVWQKTSEKDIARKGLRAIKPNTYQLATVDDAAIKTILWSAPQEENVRPPMSDVKLPLMLRSGEVVLFKVVQYDMMQPKLAAKYSDIRTFKAVMESDPTVTAQIDYTVHGLRAVITDRKIKTYIDHYQRGDKATKIIYTRAEYANTDRWECQYDGQHQSPEDGKGTGERQGDCQLREYEIAVTATGEYSNYHDADDASESALVQSAVVTTINRVNEVFEIDLAVRYILIDNNDDIYYYDPATDPFSGSSAGNMINENQTNTDAVIGNANYDIGHIFSTGGSGLASLNSLCDTGSKARGVTGIGTPEGDPFDIDYVSHEIGHQMGGNHTQNNSCNRNNNTAVEPGSASTIMGYAGICSPNVQNNSDPYFHAESIEEMADQVILENNTDPGCQDIVAWSNNAPTITAIANKTIPQGTPFVLDAVASDPNGDVITYNWEQMDTEVATMPPVSTNTGGPTFRSLEATLDSKRYFPSIDNIVNNSTDTWEVLPTVDRTMDFRLTVRDAHMAMGGCTEEIDVVLTVEADSGPFVVNTANTPTTYLETDEVLIEWNVAGTNTAPVSCSQVDILMSTDGGLTYPQVLISNATNDGSQLVTIPLGTTTQGRFMVKCSDNYFFDINDTDFSVDVGTPGFQLATTPATQTTCSPNSVVTIVVETISIQGFNSPIGISLSNLPAGATSQISTNPVVPGNNTIVTVSNIPATVQTYTIGIAGSAAGQQESTTHELMVAGVPASPILVTPADNSSAEPLNPTLAWNSSANADTYSYEIGSSPGSSDIETGTISGTSVTVQATLGLNTQYFWRVKSTNQCGTSASSTEFTFTTANCKTFFYDNTPVQISTNQIDTVYAGLTIQDRGNIIDLNVVGLVGTHSWVDDLTFALISPDDAEQVFWANPCGGQDDFDINLDDEADNSAYPCPPTDGLTYIPDNPLSFFDTKDLKGDWQLKIIDRFAEDGGELESWGLEVCLDNYCDLTVDNAGSTGPGSLPEAISCAENGDTIFIKESLNGTLLNLAAAPQTIDKNIVLLAEKRVELLFDSTTPGMIITPSTTTTFIGFDIRNVDGTAIENNGNLTIRDVNVIKENGTNDIMNGSTGQLTLEGNCQLFEE